MLYKLIALLLLISNLSIAANSITVEIGNDLFTDARSDQYLTNTFAVKVKSNDLPEFLKRFLPDYEVDSFLTHVGQDMYTPQDIETSNPDPLDRPYAGHSFVRFTAMKKRGNYLNYTTLQISLLGPASLAGKFQDTIHDWTDSTKPNGWDTQLENELGINFEKIWGYKKDLYKEGHLRVTNIMYATTSIGSINTFAGIGNKILAGFNPPDDIDFFDEKSSVYDSNWSAYLESEIRQTYVARDIFIDGNSDLFGDATILEREDFVTRWDNSAVIRFKNFFLKYTYSYTTEQFSTQNGPHKFGTISFEYRRRF